MIRRSFIAVRSHLIGCELEQGRLGIYPTADSKPIAAKFIRMQIAVAHAVDIFVERQSQKKGTGRMRDRYPGG
jgi:hypothetical protein